MPVIKNQAIRERNSIRFYGCSEHEAIRLNEGFPLRTKDSYASRYLFQRTAAFKRGIGWEITFPEWLDIWVTSGKWSLRGVGIGRFCMARNGDIGPYKVGNVSIQLATDNSRDAIKKSHKTIRDTPEKFRKGRAGTGRGWTYRDGLKNPYQVILGGKYIGIFASAEFAEAAYRSAVDAHFSSVS